ncbi:MAG: glycoside hydrolase family 76 protein [Promethearchaeota archaeon]
MLLVGISNFQPAILNSGLQFSSNKNKSIDFETPLAPERILSLLNISSYDYEYDGYFSEVDDNAVVLNDNKGVWDYPTLIHAYLDLSKYVNDSWYATLFRGEALRMQRDLLERFKLESGGYTLELSRLWAVPTNPLVTFSHMANIISLYARLFKETNNQTFLLKAENLVSFVESHFYDTIHGGFYTNLDGETLAPASSAYRRVTGYYGLYTDALLFLYELTDDSTYLERGCEILNETIEAAWNDETGYFHSKLYNTNEPDLSFPEFMLHEQVVIAQSLLHYSKYCSQAFYRSLALSLINLTFEHALDQANGMFIHSFYPDGSPHKSDFFVSRQTSIYEILMDMIGLNIPLSEIQIATLNSSFSILEQFLGENSKVFLRSPSMPIIAPWVQALVVRTIMRLNSFDSIPITDVSSSSSYPTFPLRTPGFLYISVFTGFMVFFIIIKLKRRYKKKL